MNFPLFHLLIFGICVTHFVHKAEQVESIEVETLSAEKKMSCVALPDAFRLVIIIAHGLLDIEP
jgi:hypothetical protein